MIYTADNVEDTLCVFRYRVYNQKGKSYRTYIAQIVGEDPNYILKRIFLPRYFYHYSRFDSFICVLEDGIYELMVKRFDDETGACVGKERKWLVVSDGELRLYNNDQINFQYALYTAFNLRKGGGAA